MATKTHVDRATDRLTSKATGGATNRATQGSRRKTVVVLPLELAAQIDGQVGAKHRQRFVIENCLKELRRLEQMEAVRGAAGAWRHEDHPELAENSNEWQSGMRRQWSERQAREEGEE
jgi:hypothetical protein